jgi:hypothetical protein
MTPLLLVLLSACGGGGGSDTAPTNPAPPAAAVNIDTTVNFNGGGGASQTSGAEVTVDGPAFVLSAAANVQVCASGTWTQQLRGPGTVFLFTTAQLPVPLAERTGPGFDAFGPAASTLPSMLYSQCDTHALPAGTHALRYKVRVDCAAACLSGYSGDLRWRVQTVN